MSKKKSLFADAITDAKELKDTALANAKLSLAESFAPKVQSMISSKLNEMEEELDENFEEDEKSLDEILQEMEGGTEVEGMDSEDEVLTDEDEISFEETEEFEDTEETEEVVDLTVDELKDVIRSVMDELQDESQETEEVEDLEGEVTDEEDVINLSDEEDEELDMVAENDDLNLDEILAEIEQTHQTQPSTNFEQELNEAKKTISKLKKELLENNLLLAKSIYLNKILKANTLSESKKVLVINAFDRVSTVKEAKNTFETLKESLKTSSKSNPLIENRGAASRALNVGKSREILTESKTDEFVSRMQKLAGIK